MTMAVTYATFGGQIVHEERGGVERVYVPDPLGSTAMLTDLDGNVTDRFEYRAYGEERVRTGTTPTPFRFVGALGYYRDAAGRMYVRARTYLAGLARWLTVDPLWPRERAYSYVDGHVLTHNDRSGLGFWIHSTDCSTSQLSLIVSAMNTICGALNKPNSPLRNCLDREACKVGGTATHTGWSGGTMGEFMDYLCNATTPSNPIEVSCDTGLGCKRIDGLQIPGLGHSMKLCPSAFDDRSGPLHCLMLHEFMHKGGITDHTNPAFPCLDEVKSCRGKFVRE